MTPEKDVVLSAREKTYLSAVAVGTTTQNVINDLFQLSNIFTRQEISLQFTKPLCLLQSLVLAQDISGSQAINIEIVHE